MGVSLKPLIEEVRVSSVLNRDAKQFGKKHLFDGDPETCWNSEAGESQWVRVSFSDLAVVERFVLQFQGGFACRELDVVDAEDAVVQTFYPDDSNKVQAFVLDQKVSGYSVKLVFKSPTDFYGRVTVYALEIFGAE